jgi:hypothetical protein
MSRRRSAGTGALYRDYRVAFRSGVELEVYRLPRRGYRMLAADHMRNTPPRGSDRVLRGDARRPQAARRTGARELKSVGLGLRFAGPRGPGF